MKYRNVNIESVGYVLPERVVTSLELEELLKPLYDRLGLIPGRLEMMSGIGSRRFWQSGTLPSEVAARAGADALRRAGRTPEEVDCLIHCSVSRDFVEPATSTAVHRLLGCRQNILNFDVSNACLGMASAVLILADMIETGQISCGLAVSGENAGPLVENTVARMNGDLGLTRRTVKDQFASLTIGSCAVAVLVSRNTSGRAGHPLLAMAHASDSSGNQLCKGDAAGGMTDGSAPVMATDSSALLQKGVQVARNMWDALKQESGWSESTPECICTHQVGKAHSALLFESLGLDPARDFVTYPFLGNCGSASWPVTVAMAEEQGRLCPGMSLAILGIGSGINSAGMAVRW